MSAGIVHLSSVFDRNDRALAALSGLTVVQAQGQANVFVASAGENAVSRLNIGLDGTLSLAATSVQVAHSSLQGLAYLHASNTVVATSNFGTSTLSFDPVSLTQQTVQELDLSYRISAISAESHNNLDYITWADPTMDGFQLSVHDAWGALVNTATFKDTSALPLGDVTAMTSLTLNDQVVLIAGSGRDSGIAVMTLGADGSSQVLDIKLPGAEFAHYGVSNIKTVEHGGNQFVIATAYASSSITVFKLNADGTLTATDHLFDTQLTRFNGVTELSILEFGAQVALAVGGNDGGVTLLELDTTGRLEVVTSLIDTADTAMADISGLELMLSHDGADVFVFTTSARDSGVSSFSIDIETYFDGISVVSETAQVGHVGSQKIVPVHEFDALATTNEDNSPVENWLSLLDGFDL